jgi:hypothetical protein
MSRDIIKVIMSKKLNRQKLRQIRYSLRHDVFTKQNIITILIIGLSLVWLVSAVQAISQNYKQQKRLDAKLREAKIIELEAENLAYEQDYYRSEEYQDIALRQKTNLVLPGEKVLILDDYPVWVVEKEAELDKTNQSVERPEPSNFRKWMDFFFGAKSVAIQ